ncbi:putative glucan 1,3-beta-glucosidase D [Golovinomyces cichoracearum]|uniref:glucan 1,3-beta-glucosidase n=1 Tax=Golovinomyces cichoracearum TaxID=62708 RepID=A0A420H8W3_9PEZI|nr:putative glucan 1,3-beta-glucosidase D [Golovinomyces cichoracearum]
MASRPHSQGRNQASNKKRSKKSKKRRKRSSASRNGGTHTLSEAALAELDRLNHENLLKRPDVVTKKTPHRKIPDISDINVEMYRSKRNPRERKRRVASADLLEAGLISKLRGKKEYTKGTGKKKKKYTLDIGIGMILTLLIIIIVAVVVSKQKKGKSSSAVVQVSTENIGKPSNTNLNDIDESSIPVEAKDTYLDPFSWYDTADFNVTYTNETVGGLPIMGLNTTWDDSKNPNPNTPPISTPWGSYGVRPARGVNLGGWLSLEPFITPSLFQKFGAVDEYTLVSRLGSSAKKTLEEHYATFVTEQTFIDIADAGLDHVRIPYSYWAVTVYDSDPYLFRVSWRYLLRGIEWARKHGLRINLDLHALPGSQNGWNHSGKLGPIEWLSGPKGNLNARRSLEIHDQLSKFFAQDRYKNIICFYGLANEPKMTVLDKKAVIEWTAEAFNVVRKNGIAAFIVFGDGFMGLANWKDKLQGIHGLVLDAHQYVIFDKNLIVFNHSKKIEYACEEWSSQAQQSMSTSTGFGPTIFAEWSQADTDCALNLNNVGWGTRWTGTYNHGDPDLDALTPACPLKNAKCDCTNANADPQNYSNTYKQFLQTFAEAQMASFEKGWGWFYWTWKTEAATQWSYQLGLEAGILPKKAYAPEYSCSSSTPNFAELPEYY